MLGFFKQESPMELSRLQAQAQANTDRLAHMAQLQLKALSARHQEAKPKLLLSMTLHAPKVAIAGESSSPCALCPSRHPARVSDHNALCVLLQMRLVVPRS